MAEPLHNEQFLHQLINCQDVLNAYIWALVADRHQAQDILQETNSAILRKSGEFEQIVDFRAWACRVAYFEVKAHLTRRKRDRHLFDTGLLELISDTMLAQVSDATPRQEALRACLQRLPEAQRSLLMRRYSSNNSIQRIAEELQRPIGSIYQTLHRARRSLLECVLRKLEDRS